VFTGIVAEVGKAVSIQSGSLVIGAGKVLDGLQVGGSIAINGVCLTVTSFDARSPSFSVDIMPETRQRTNLGLLNIGDRVNLERPLKYGGEVGGHLVQGHVDTTGKIESIVPDGEALRIRFVAPADIMRYIVEKGFIAIDGISLTVVEKSAGSFSVSVVSYTRNNTTLNNKKTGDVVNLEADIMAKYAEQFYQSARTGVTMNILKENGFLFG
jgi:riboflavin synthase